MTIKDSVSVLNLTYNVVSLLNTWASIDKKIMDITWDCGTFWREERWTVLVFCL